MKLRKCKIDISKLKVGKKVALNFLNHKHKTNFTRNFPIVIYVGPNLNVYGLVTSSSGLDYLYIRLISGEKMKIDYRKVKPARLCDYNRAYNKYHLLEYTMNRPLKRCPFCQHKPRRTLMPDGRITYRCSNTRCIISDSHQGYDSLDEAAIDWNRRLKLQKSAPRRYCKASDTSYCNGVNCWWPKVPCKWRKTK
jgi:hypothetical protein